MVVHPKNPDIAFAAVLGHAFGPNPGAREVFATCKGEMDALASEWKALLAGEIAALNQISQPAIVIPIGDPSF